MNKTNNYTGLEIAIIGISGRFPEAYTVGGFWKNLKEGKDAVKQLTDEELRELKVDETYLSDKNFVKSGVFLEGKGNFDAAFFGYLPREAEVMDPQIRIFHECVWEALEDAGINPEDADYPISLFGAASDNMLWRTATMLSSTEGIDAFSLNQFNNKEFISSLVSYKLGLTGVSTYINTACSSSLVAVHMACRNLLMGESRVAIAGGISVSSSAKNGYFYKEGMIYSSDGYVRTFDAKASGTIKGEGAGVLILKKLEEAIKDKDPVYAIIKGSSTNNDGQDKVGYAAPGLVGQTNCIRMAQKIARVEPSTIGYVEAHGTATKLGDVIEIAALNNIFGKSSEKYCAIGSVKTNIGHLDAAAGVLGMIKTVLSLKNKQLPPSLHFSEPNPEIDFSGPFYVNTKLKDWNRINGNRLRAAVSSFGIGGNNAHVILEEAPDTEPAASKTPFEIIVLSAKTVASLNEYSKKFAAFLKEAKNEELPDIAYSLLTGRKHFNYRRMLLAKSNEEAIELLSDPQGCQTVMVQADPFEIAFMFSGQGSQYINMARELYENEHYFREQLDSCFEIAKKYDDIDYRSVLFPVNMGRESAARLSATEFLHPILFSIQYSIAAYLIHLGIKPDYIIGHSLGEYAGACICNILSLEDAIKIVLKRGKLLSKIEAGEMLSINISEVNLSLLITDEISICGINSPENCVVGGSRTSISKFEKKLKDLGFVFRKLNTSHAFHSHLVDPILREFESELQEIKWNEPAISFISTLTGKLVNAGEISSPGYWSRHLRQTVRFSQGAEILLKRERMAMIEIGPGFVLSTFIKQQAPSPDSHKCFSTLKHHDVPGMDKCMYSLLGNLWLLGIKWNTASYYQNKPVRKRSLPTYAFEKTTYPFEVDLSDFKVWNALKKTGKQRLFSPVHHIPANSEAMIQVKQANEPVSEMEKLLSDIWLDFFGLQTIGTKEDFFELGGDSLKAMQLISKIDEAMNVKISLKLFLENRSIQKLAREIENVMKESDAAVENTMII